MTGLVILTEILSKAQSEGWLTYCAVCSAYTRASVACDSLPGVYVITDVFYVQDGWICRMQSGLLIPLQGGFRHVKQRKSHHMDSLA